MWKAILVISLLAFFAAMGVAHVLKPDYFLKRSGLRKGGQMLNEWNRLQFQIVGAVITVAAGYVLYTLLAEH